MFDLFPCPEAEFPHMDALNLHYFNSVYRVRDTSVLMIQIRPKIGAFLPDSDPEFFFLPDPDPFRLRTKHEKS